MQIASTGALMHDSERRSPASRSRVARVGPNTLIQTLEALRISDGVSWSTYIAARAGLPEPLPQGMVDERFFEALVSTLIVELGPAQARHVLSAGGDGTGRYVLMHRIPPIARWLLRRLPRGLSLRLLLRAIGAHAWTFTGRGRFNWRQMPEGAEFTLEPSVVCEVAGPSTLPMGTYYARAVRALIRALVDPCAHVEETSCVCTGASVCQFRIFVGPAARRHRSLSVSASSSE